MAPRRLDQQPTRRQTTPLLHSVGKTPESRAGVAQRRSGVLVTLLRQIYVDFGNGLWWIRWGRWLG
jgi:hypothetical protein